MKILHFVTFNVFAKKPIDVQIDRYVRNKAKRSEYAANNHREWLEIFKNLSGRKNVFDVTDRDITYYLRWVEDEYRSIHVQSQARIALQGFLKFFKMLDWELEIDEKHGSK